MTAPAFASIAGAAVVGWMLGAESIARGWNLRSGGLLAASAAVTGAVSLFLTPAPRLGGAAVVACAAAVGRVRSAFSRRGVSVAGALEALPLDVGARRKVIVRELAWERGRRVVEALAVLGCAWVVTVGWWEGTLGVAGCALLAAGRRVWVPPTAPVGATVDDPVTVVVGESSDVFWDVVAAQRAGGAEVAAAPAPVLFRALAGWNLGLGLDAERAAWAAHLAGRLGVRDMLGEPAPLVDEAAAGALVICRVLASPGEVVVLDDPVVAALGGRRDRVARLVAAAIGDRRLILVVRRPETARLFRRAFERRPPPG